MTDEEAAKVQKDIREEERWKDIYEDMSEKEIMEDNPHTWKHILYTHKRYQNTEKEMEIFG